MSDDATVVLRTTITDAMIEAGAAAITDLNALMRRLDGCEVIARAVLQAALAAPAADDEQMTHIKTKLYKQKEDIKKLKAARDYWRQRAIRAMSRVDAETEGEAKAPRSEDKHIGGTVGPSDGKRSSDGRF